MRLLTTWRDYIAGGRVRVDLGSGVVLDTARVGNGVNPRAHGAAGDGVTDDTAAIARAVAVAKAESRAVSWPAGTYVTASSIPDLHTVRHEGPGVVKAGVYTFYPAPVTGQANTLYVDPAGSDTNDGLHTNRPFREIRAAVAALGNYSSPLRGSWKIKVAAGTYKGGVILPASRNGHQDDFVRIEGPTTGHPNVPAVVIDKAADTAAANGVTAYDGASLYLQDIKVSGGFAYAVDVRRNVYLWLKNFHGDGLNTAGSSGVAVNTHSRYYVAGGRLENYPENGISELFHVTRSFNNVGSNAEQMTIANCGVGVQAKENCVGHLDYLNVEGCLTGVEMNAYCVVNVKSITLKRNTLGYANVNSEIHNEGGIVWGTGVDANTRDFITLGAGQELAVSGWADSSTARTMNVGHRAAVTVAADYTDRTATATTETSIVSLASALKARRYTTAGKSYKVVVRGRVAGTAPLVANYRLMLRTGGQYMIDAFVPAGTPVGAVFTVTWTVTCTADGNNQKVFSELTVNGAGSTGYATRTVDMTLDRSAALSGISGATGDTLTIHSVEVWG